MSTQDTFKLGDYLVISPEYPDTILQNQTGAIIALPDKDHPNEYCIELDGGIARSVAFAGQIVWINGNYLERKSTIR